MQYFGEYKIKVRDEIVDVALCLRLTYSAFESSKRL